ncbi:hypothetical protein N24_0057 [Corynebacterium suranareeae]|uniref:DUF1684 domain-containing protein n=1 Tax=Corynebacterium suranareeae TaxID=2506452 RepID=A0A160PL19_9CORY|nr:DUF1684 domain-containing protein [Corynebacterium suranareeae]BAU94319.1 hypothetical protein N24_0057 [Corynebacterium suranareeae]
MNKPLTQTVPELNTQAWELWHKEREAKAVEATGPTALIGTFWVTASTHDGAEEFPGIPGKWFNSANGLTGEGLPQPYSTTGTIQLQPGDKIDDGEVLLTAIERQGNLAIRAFNRNALSRQTFQGIATFEPSQKWIVPATFEADTKLVDVLSADGRIIPTTTAGWIHFPINGSTYKLQVTDNGSSFSAVFTDASTANGVHRFRNISLGYPDAQGDTFIDFNRTWLPPFAFSEHFLCPTPTKANVLGIAIEAGEKWVEHN